MMDFHSTHVFSVKKADNSANFTADGIINHRTQEHTLGDQLCDGLQGQESCDATSHTQGLPLLY
jgi:hypothetical protein